MSIVLVVLLQTALSPPLFYWGARAPVISVEPVPSPGDEARVLEVHAVRDGTDLFLRLTLDRPARTAVYLAGGIPVSGRLRAVLYLDADGNRATGFAEGPRDLRTGADYRLEIGVVTVGEDPHEKRLASAVVTAALSALGADGRRRAAWRTDDAARPRQLSLYGEWVELRLPIAQVPLRPGARIVLAQGDGAWDGRLP